MAQVQEKKEKVSGVRTVLVVLPARGLTFDVSALRAHIQRSYPDAAVYFRHTNGKSMGPQAPSQVDLLIDFTGPWHRQNPFASFGLRRMARVAVGRNAWLGRKNKYDRVFDEKQQPVLEDTVERERRAQFAVLAMAGVSTHAHADATPDLSHSVVVTSLSGKR